MAHKIRLSQPKHLQSLVEWRFPRAHRYWDDPGKLIHEIEEAFPGLNCQGLEPDGFNFTGKGNGITGAKFHWEKASIGQAGLGDEGLSAAAETFWRLVVQVLKPTTISFLGHRTWLCYETDSVNDAIRALNGLRIWEPGIAIPDLGTPVPAGTVLRTKIEASNRRLRLAFDAGTMTISGKSIKGVIVDADIVLGTTELIEPESLKEFVDWNIRFINDTVDGFVRSRR
jgi:hypothetical protein